MIGLRPFRPSDHGLVRRWIDTWSVGEPFPQGAPLHSDQDVRRIVRGNPEPNLARLAIEVDGRVIGEAQYRFGSPIFPPGVFSIGIVLWDRTDRGKGHGREAQRQVVDLLFEAKDARRVEAGTDPGNVAERRCLVSLGFREEGVLRKYLPSPEGGGDIVMYGLLREDWQERHGKRLEAATPPIG